MPPRKRRKLTPLEDSDDEPYPVADSFSSTPDPDLPSQPNATPTRRKAPAKRGRPRKATTQPTAETRERTPPRALPPHEKYFFDNRPGAHKTSNTTLPASALLSHEDYFEALKDHIEPHAPDIAFLHATHAVNFEQWAFELREGFSVCLHGWGSKRALVDEFADFMAAGEDADDDSEEQEEPPRVVVVNGFAPGITSKDILTTLASTIPSLSKQASSLPAQPADLLSTILAALPPTGSPRYYLCIHSLDSSALRKPATQTQLATLAAHPALSLLASCDTPTFPLLWDSRHRAAFNWAFHDATTFASMTAEVRAVDAVNTILGRSGRRAQGRDGVLYVLRSLTESARRLYALLLAEALDAGAADEGHEGVGTVEYRGLYRKGVSMLIAASEIQFRQLLKEFFDHEMLTNERDGAGTELLGVPFRREECEGILEELALEE